VLAFWCCLLASRLTWNSGYLIGQGKPGFILMDGEPERYDVMYKFATVVFSVEELVEKLNV
jgi:hypothetical protein